MSRLKTTWPTKIRRDAIRAALALATLAIVAVPFAVAWYLHVLGLQVTEQFSTAATALPAQQATAAAAAGRGLPDRTPPVVLTYHDIRPLAPTEKFPDPTTHPNYHYVVSPEDFDAQLTALQTAGYASITSDQYVDYLSGGALPRRSVLITFDDGTHGLWTHADKILERHGMHGVSFLITGNVGAKRPYYLSWQEIHRMAASGRWDFQSHTRKMHARLPVDAQGTVASELVHRRWLSESNRVESLSEFETKIRADLNGSVEDIVAQGLPRPRLFAFPFSEGFHDGVGGDPEAAAVAARVVGEIFACSFNNAPPQPLPSGARAAAVGMVGRIELKKDSTIGQLLADVRARTPVTPAQAAPAVRTDLWTTLADATAVAVADGQEVRLLGQGLWEGLAYGRHATADWASYRVKATISGLADDGAEGAALLARVGSGEEVSAHVSSSVLQLTVGPGLDPVLVGELQLPPRDWHTVEVTVSPTTTTVAVDGEFTLSAPSAGGPASYGGIGLTSSRTSEATPWPIFTELSIAEGGDQPNVRSGVGVPVPS